MVISAKIEIDKFSGKSFELWKLKMEYLLVEKDQWIIMDPCTISTQLIEDWTKFDQKVENTIQLCLPNLVLWNVLREVIVKALWNNLGASQ